MIASFAAMALALISADPPNEPDRRIEVTGTIATRVEFRGAARFKVVEAALELLESCHYSHQPGEGPMPDWDETLQRTRDESSHLHMRLDPPRVVTIAGGQERVTISEMLIRFPFNRGGMWVREGHRAKAFGK